MPAAATELAAMKTAPMEAAGMEAPDVDVQVGTAKMKARARTATGAERAIVEKGARILAALRRLPEEDRARDPGGRARSYALTPEPGFASRSKTRAVTLAEAYRRPIPSTSLPSA
jgi:hypothetical protein